MSLSLLLLQWLAVRFVGLRWWVGYEKHWRASRRWDTDSELVMKRFTDTARLRRLRVGN